MVLPLIRPKTGIPYSPWRHLESESLETSPPLGIVCFPLNDSIVHLRAGTKKLALLISRMLWIHRWASHSRTNRSLHGTLVSFSEFTGPPDAPLLRRHVQDGDPHPGKVLSREQKAILPGCRRVPCEVQQLPTNTAVSRCSNHRDANS
jgi:hypothetical protein